MEIFANVPALVKHPGTDLTWESVIEPSKLFAYVPDINSADANTRGNASVLSIHELSS